MATVLPTDIHRQLTEVNGARCVVQQAREWYTELSEGCSEIHDETQAEDRQFQTVLLNTQNAYRKPETSRVSVFLQ